MTNTRATEALSTATVFNGCGRVTGDEHEGRASMKNCVCGHEMTAHDWKNQWVCHRCGRTRPLKVGVTNADRIRAMSDEELAELLYGIDGRYCHNDPECGKLLDLDEGIPEEKCKDCVLRWLQQPAEGECP